MATAGAPYPAQLADAAGTPVGLGDHVTALADPLTPALVVAVDPAAGVLTVQAAGARAALPALHARVVTVRDAHGVRLGDGDHVRGIDQPGAGPTWVVSRINYLVGMLSLCGPDGDASVTLPALVVRAGAAVAAGDQVIDAAGVLGVVLEERGPVCLVEPVLTGGPAAEHPRGELRRALEPHPGVQVDPDGRWSVPALDADALADVADIMAGTWAPNVVPLPRRAG